MTATIDTLDDVEQVDVDLDAPPVDDLPPIDPWDHAEPITPPAPEPVDGGLRPAVREMVAELDTHYKGGNCPSIDKTAAAMKDVSAKPKSWGSRGQVDEAIKAYRAKHGLAVKPARTTPAKPRRTAPVRTAPAKPVPPVVRDDPQPVVQPAVRQPVPQPPAVVQPAPVPHPEPTVRTAPPRRPVVWPVMLLAAPAFVAIWGGWVGLGGLTGFGKVNLLPGIGGGFTIDSAITLPIGVETYGAYALYVWLSGRVSERTLLFARTSAITSLLVGALGQVAYHLLVAAGVESAPWWITTLVACLPVAVLGMGAALAHMVREES